MRRSRMIEVPDEVLAAMSVFCFVGWCVAWRIAKRRDAIPSAVSVATIAFQLTGVVCTSLLFVGVIHNYYGHEFNDFMPAMSISSAPAPSEMVRPNQAPPIPSIPDDDPPPACPDYFRWIHEDLWSWKKIGITEEMIEKAKWAATFRLVVLNGTAYVETYKESYQTRDKFTIWGILQLLHKYPGRIPDLDLMFFCHDIPQIKVVDYVSRDFSSSSSSSSWRPPPIFGYCSDDASLDIVFPDWSFWGWPEVSIKPWETLLKDLVEGNKKTRWVDREPYAYWKGNPDVSPVRGDLMKCNPAADGSADWNARLFHQDWVLETENGFHQSNLADQCNYRYKIYVEGTSWSVSQKYILACDSPALLITPKYHDFFTRGLMPMQHYYPIDVNFMCDSINSTVSFGNSHQQEAQEIGREGSEFIQKNLKMDYVYEYMFQLLNEYSKLLRFKPTVPSGAVEITSKSMAAKEQGLIKKFMMDSRVPGISQSSSSDQCTLPPPFTPGEFKAWLHRKNILAKQGDLYNLKN